MTYSVTVKRRNRPDWVFSRDSKDCKFVHTTRRGNTYVIVIDYCGIKPVWIGRVCFNREGEVILCTAEDEIRAVSIEFTFGSYVFR